ncbi:MAG: hypothetical protein AAF441_11465 [Pseudomonadota bacterium]
MNSKAMSAAFAAGIFFVSLVFLAPIKQDQANASAVENAPRTTVIYKSTVAPSTAEIVRAACQISQCLDV